MDPAESVVSLWLQTRGFFLMNNVPVGKGRGREIDFLGVNPTTNSYVHVEVTVSVKPTGPLRPNKEIKTAGESLEKRMRGFYLKKFVGISRRQGTDFEDGKIEEAVRGIFGGRIYEKWLVLGEQGGADTPEKVRAAFHRLGVKVLFLEEVMNDIELKTIRRDETGRQLQLAARYLSPTGRIKLIGKKAATKASF